MQCADLPMARCVAGKKQTNPFRFRFISDTRRASNLVVGQLLGGQQFRRRRAARKYTRKS
jgi:hypothetical protein